MISWLCCRLHYRRGGGVSVLTCPKYPPVLGLSAHGERWPSQTCVRNAKCKQRQGLTRHLKINTNYSNTSVFKSAGRRMPTKTSRGYPSKTLLLLLCCGNSLSVFDDRHQIKPNLSGRVPRDAFLNCWRHHTQPVVTPDCAAVGKTSLVGWRYFAENDWPRLEPV